MTLKKYPQCPYIVEKTLSTPQDIVKKMSINVGDERKMEMNLSTMKKREKDHLGQLTFCRIVHYN